MKHLNAPGNSFTENNGSKNNHSRLTPKLNALSTLAELKFSELRRQYPNVPVYAIPRTRYNDRTSNGLTACIIDFLRLNGCYAVRINTTGQFRNGKWIKGTTTRGTADIHSVIAGRHVSIEVKAGRDKLSPHQIKQAAIIQQAGGLYIVARNFQSFYNWFNSLP